MQKPRIITQEERAFLRRHYGTMTQKELRDHFHCSFVTIRRWIVECGLPLRPRRRWRPFRQLGEALDLVEDGLSFGDAARLANVPTSTLTDRCRDLGIKSPGSRRGGHEYRQVREQRLAAAREDMARRRRMVGQ